MVYESCVGCNVPLCHDVFSPSSIMLADSCIISSRCEDWGYMAEKPEPIGAL